MHNSNGIVNQVIGWRVGGYHKLIKQIIEAQITYTSINSNSLLCLRRPRDQGEKHDILGNVQMRHLGPIPLW